MAATPSSLHHYFTYGLSIASQLPLPELVALEGIPGDADVQIVVEPVAEALAGATSAGAWWQVAPGVYQFTAAGIARYRVEHGRRITLELLGARQGGADAGDARVYLLGTALGALLHQRGLLPLHVSALRTGGGDWAFSGPSGAGKSTLAAWLHRSRGWPLVTDDVAAVDPSDGLPCLHGGPVRMKLWRDALQTLGISETGLARDLTRADKFHLVFGEGTGGVARPLRAIVVLESADRDGSAELRRMSGLDALRALGSCLYRPELALHFRREEDLLGQLAQLADRVAIYRYRRPRGFDQLEANLEPLLQAMDCEPA